MPRKPNVADAYAAEDFPIDRKLPVADQLYRIIRQQIVELALAPGAPISDSAIGFAAGISRTPTREAIKRLEDENLIVVYPSQGSFITKISVPRVEEAIFLREMLEPEVAARCARLPDRSALLTRLGQIRGASPACRGDEWGCSVSTGWMKHSTRRSSMPAA